MARLEVLTSSHASTRPCTPQETRRRKNSTQNPDALQAGRSRCEHTCMACVMLRGQPVSVSASAGGRLGFGLRASIGPAATLRSAPAPAPALPPSSDSASASAGGSAGGSGDSASGGASHARGQMYAHTSAMRVSRSLATHYAPALTVQVAAANIQRERTRRNRAVRATIRP